MVFLTVIHTVVEQFSSRLDSHRAAVLPLDSARQGSWRRGGAASEPRMSTARTTELTLSARANAYVALTKPDVSFLVLMTTAAGYYMGCAVPSAGCT